MIEFLSQSDFLVSPNPLDKFRTKCIVPEMITLKFQIYCTRKKKLTSSITQRNVVIHWIVWKVNGTKTSNKEMNYWNWTGETNAKWCFLCSSLWDRFTWPQPWHTVQKLISLFHHLKRTWRVHFTHWDCQDETQATGVMVFRYFTILFTVFHATIAFHAFLI